MGLDVDAGGCFTLLGFAVFEKLATMISFGLKPKSNIRREQLELGKF
jgi:hypothetical protein